MIKYEFGKKEKERNEKKQKEKENRKMKQEERMNKPGLYVGAEG